MAEPTTQLRVCGRRAAALLGGVLAALMLWATPSLAGGGLSGLPGSSSDPDPTDGSALVSLRLVSERTALQPGGESWIGLHFKIHDGWHLYWRNNGDTGAPMQIAISASPGVEIGDVVYPAPTTHPEPGGFVDYVYENEVTLLVPVSVSQSLPLGSQVKIDATVGWLVCRELCLAGHGESSIRLPIAGAAQPTPNAPLFAAARSRVPAPMEDAKAAGIRTRWSDSRTLVITAPGASSLTFFPYESDADAYPQDMAERGTVRADTIHLQYNDHAADADHLGGVLEVRTPDKTSWYEIVVGSPPADPH